MAFFFLPLRNPNSSIVSSTVPLLRTNTFQLGRSFTPAPGKVQLLQGDKLWGKKLFSFDSFTSKGGCFRNTPGILCVVPHHALPTGSSPLPTPRNSHGQGSHSGLAPWGITQPFLRLSPCHAPHGRGTLDPSQSKAVTLVSEENGWEGSGFIADLELSFQGLKFGIT